MEVYEPKEFWNKVSPYFADPNSENSEFSWREGLQKEHEILFEWIDKIKPKSVLQVGIGFGREIKIIDIKYAIYDYKFIGIWFEKK